MRCLHAQPSRPSFRGSEIACLAACCKDLRKRAMNKSTVSVPLCSQSLSPATCTRCDGSVPHAQGMLCTCYASPGCSGPPPPEIVAALKAQHHDQLWAAAAAMTAAPKLEPSATGVNSSRRSSSLQREPAWHSTPQHIWLSTPVWRPCPNCAGHLAMHRPAASTRRRTRAPLQRLMLSGPIESDSWLTECLTQVLPQELAPVGVLEEHTAIHCNHQAARHLHPVLQAQHCDQQAGSKAGAAACHKPADGLDLQHDSSGKSPSTVQAAASRLLQGIGAQRLAAVQACVQVLLHAGDTQAPRQITAFPHCTTSPRSVSQWAGQQGPRQGSSASLWPHASAGE